MKNNYTSKVVGDFHPGLKKLLIIINLITIFLIVGLVQVSASTYSEFPKGEIPQQQQKTTLKGVVKDQKGNTLPGVTISVKGTNKAAITDINGNYSIKVTDNDKTLVFSFIGMKKQTVLIGNQPIINIVMESETSTLDEVVVVGFGTQKRVSVTGAIASINTKEIKQSPAANLAVTLAGRLPGLTAIQRTGEPGADVVNLYIRGQGTTNAQNPIILVDGIERDLTYIDPNEIATVTILKDASSTALFGIRGANGVILVTTKRGTSEIPEINFTTEASAQSFTRLPHLVNSWQYATLKDLAQANDGLAQSYSDAAIQHYKTQDDPLRYPNTDWEKILTKKYSLQQRYNLNVSGASKAVKYFVNVGYLDQGSQFKVESGLPYDPSFNLKRYNFRSNIDVQLNKTLKAFLNIAGALEKQNGPYYPTGSSPASFYVLAYMVAQLAISPGPLTPDGKVLTSSALASAPPYGILNRWGYIQNNRTNVTASYGMEQSLDSWTKGLSVKVMGSFDTKSSNYLYASKDFERYIEVIDPVTNAVSYVLGNSKKETPLSISGAESYVSLENIQGYINYNRKFHKSEVTGLLMFQQQNNIIDQQLPFNYLGTASRLTYGYDNKYFGEINLGYNGSEQFAPGHRFGFFPAASLAWIASSEKFLENNKIITNLKIRGSYGAVGNDRIGGSRFQYLDNITVGSGGFSSSLGNNQRINISSLGNVNLKWEVAKKADLGFELGILNSFNIVLDLFDEKRDNILATQGSIPTLSGMSSSVLPELNFGRVDNRGYEFELNYKKIIDKNFSIIAKVNYNHARNKEIFTDESELPADYAYRYRQTGYEIGQMFGYVVDRYFIDATDIANSPVQNVGGHVSRPGDFRYKDLNKDGVIDAKDIAPVGYSNVPENQFGAAINLTYKNFDFSVLFQGVSHVSQFFNMTFGSWEGWNYSTRDLGSWTVDRVANGLPITYPRLTTQTSPNNLANSFWIVDCSYIRLKNAEIGYTMPKNVARKIGAKELRIYVNGLNLITWDKLPTKDWDPEVAGDRGENAYPQLSVFNLGVNIKF